MDKEIIHQPLARAIAFYLPQYHPIPENDGWWGTGFTEWTNVTKAKPLYKGHLQPALPADLGFYDLRVPETRIQQADLAREAGIEGFCYWHYWFGNGRQILERPIRDMLQSGQPDFPFCICWANESWTGIWHGAGDTVLVEQTYPGIDDYRAYFNHLLSYFKDDRYIKVDGKPVFTVYSPQHLPEPGAFTDRFRQWAMEAGFPGLYLVSLTKDPSHINWGFDAFGSKPPGAFIGQLVNGSWWKRRWQYRLRDVKQGRRNGLKVYDYRHFIAAELEHPLHNAEIPVLVPNWDNTPRSGMNGLVLENANPGDFADYLQEMVNRVSHRPGEERILFLKAWNEWAEGNHLEPDLKYGKAWLEACRKVLFADT